MSITAKAIWYIESHLKEDLSLDAVAQNVGVSRYHLSRAFAVSITCGLSSYVRARRLTEAAKALRNGSPEILPVALDAGYASHEAFTRAFRQHFGISPEQARAQPSLPLPGSTDAIRPPSNLPLSLLPPQFRAHSAVLLYGLARQYLASQTAAIPSQWESFIPHLGSIPNRIGDFTYGVVYNAGEAGSFDYLCGVEVNAFPPPLDNAGWTHLRIAPQTYAVFHHGGHISEIAAVCQSVWNHALPESGRTPVDAPWFERYGPEFNGRTGQGGFEIWIPVE